MNKHLYITLFYCLLFSFSASSQEQNILQDFNLNGKVKRIVANEWLIRNNVSVKRTMSVLLMNKVTTLNEKGQVVSSFNIDSTAGKKGYAIAYDTIGKMVTRTIYGHSPEIIKYEYEQQLHKRLMYAVNEKKQRTMVREEMLNDKGQVTERIDYTVGNPTWINGKMEETSIHDSLANKTIYRYNEKGKLLEESDYNNDTLDYHAVYSYNTEGNLLSSTIERHRDSKETWSWNWQKDIKTQSIKMRYRDGKKETTTMYFYDRSNHIVRELENNHTTNTSRATLYEYIFDKTGNWTQRKMYWIVDGKKNLAFTVDRTITYFE